MENDRGLSHADRDEIAAQLHEAERAAAAPYLEYPPTTWWEPWAVGAYAAAQGGLLALAFSDSTPAWYGPAQTALLALVVLYLVRQQRRHGALPSTFWGPQVPPEIERSFRGYLVGVIAVVGVVVGLAALTTPWITAVVAALLAFGGFQLYDRRYRAAAERARARLA